MPLAAVHTDAEAAFRRRVRARLLRAGRRLARRPGGLGALPVVHPRLPALTRDTRAFGRTAATELLSPLDGAPAPTVQVPVPRLIERESTGRAKGAPQGWSSDPRQREDDKGFLVIPFE
ncbi:hypothetical protein GCM10023082_20070 [Streptomyces tremellae]|uniref:Uncharacterized protein n=1 Tax=Streptomyces tremellae TaxID=1124239 RepID=A0ABP7EQF8_9ACTN